MSKQSGRSENAMHHVLVAADGSSGGERALEFAARLARDTKSPLSIVNVSDDLSAADLQALSQIEGGMLEELDQLSNDVLDRAKRRLAGSGVADIRTHVAWGHPVEGILETARTLPADIIVVGRRGLGQLAGLLVGSVSQKLAGDSPVPVIIVP